MSINEISRNGPEIIFSFRIIACWNKVRVILLERLLVPLPEKHLVPLLVQDDP